MSGELLGAIDGLVARLAELDPRAVSVAECTVLVKRLARLENASAAARAATARVVAERGAPDGHTKPADWLARTTGSSTRHAESELSTASDLDRLPTTREAARRGELSPEQTREISSTAKESPESEEEMLDLARKTSLRSLRDEGRKRRHAKIDPDELHEKQRAARNHRHWRDELGMIRYSGAMLPEVGVPFMNRLDAETDRLFRAQRREGGTDTADQLAADAFASLIAGGGKGHATRADIVYVCDLDTGRSHVVGGGLVPNAAVDDAAKDAFIKAVVHDGTKIDTVVHYGRHNLPAVVRTAISLGDPPDFDGISCADCGNHLGLQWDHVDPVANGGPTTRCNLEPRCYRCHAAKTERDRRDGKLNGARAP